MSEEHGFPILVDGFMSVSDDAFCDEPELRWYCAPDCWQEEEVDASKEQQQHSREGKDGSWTVDDDGQLIVKAPAKKDFWRKTYYSPLLVKDDGPCLFATIHLSNNKAYMATTTFTMTPPPSGNSFTQFDQAGLMIRLDSDHWLKTGIEVVDGIPRLSCVVTNGYSDWSTQRYWKETPNQVKLRTHILPNHSIVVEAWEESIQNWTFIRIAHLHLNSNCHPDPLEKDPIVQNAWTGKSAPDGHMYVGVFAACPEDQKGTTVTFHDFQVVEGSTFKHNADGNH